MFDTIVFVWVIPIVCDGEARFCNLFFFFLFNVFLLLLLLVCIFLSVALSYAGMSPVARGAASDGMRITFSILLAFISYLFFIFKRLGFIF